MVLGWREPGRGRASGGMADLPHGRPTLTDRRGGKARGFARRAFALLFVASVLTAASAAHRALGTDGARLPAPRRRGSQPVQVRFEELHEKCFQADGEERPLLVFTVGTGGSQDHP